MKNDESQWFLRKTTETGKFIVQSRTMSITPHLKPTSGSNHDRYCRDMSYTAKKRTENYSNSFEKINAPEFESLPGT
ncbi:hypothetical protein IWQ47_001839 [Aquimarina sp. EL_43]|uniref:hypothetical protein n=1 Tax=Aquimarina TaxID=290174 RepID=UPI0004704690|nr:MULTISPECIES: hypothetical protein [Aquimarina]MBG6130078.1 hypothetical protein [Aquimarina sp. EL_35]MBG6148858.1 hypothetical protein [Aquimarina sp. EL_32]MBG6168768.1 hypothetical protein [Aquimarina sp. EL_43]